MKILVNAELASLLDEMQNRIVKKAQKESQTTLQKKEVPTDFVLKLAILGRAFSGKKTVAK
jgi:hypothetical protein